MALVVAAPLATVAPAQAGLLGEVPLVGDVAETTGGILDPGPVLDEITETVLDPDEVLDTTTGVVTDPSGTVTKIIDPETGVVTDGGGELLGVLDPITGQLMLPPLPGIDPSSTAGQLLTQVGGAWVELCSTSGGPCDQVPLADLVDEAAVVFRAVPVNPGDIPMWDPETCPEIIADVCLIPLEDLTGDTPLAPIVTFLPGSSGDPDAPDTRITSGAPGKQKTSHTFAFEAEPATPTTRFECKLSVAYKSSPPAGAQRAHDWQPCGTDPAGQHAYKDLANGTYVFAVQAVDGPEDDRSVDDTPATQSWTVAMPPEVPETRIVSGPKPGAWVMANKVVYRFRSTVEGSQFQCDYDRFTDACDSGSFTWTNRSRQKLTPGTHVFKVKAFANKTQDFSPAQRSFHVPYDDRAFAGSKWSRSTMKQHFKNTVSTTTVKGATLVSRQTLKFRRIALVADRGPGFGTVKVFWGQKMLKEVDLQAKRLQQRKVIPIRKYAGKLRSGKLRIVVTSAGKTVRIDGLGAAKR